MRVNVGNMDRVLRMVLGALFVVAPLVNFPPIWSSTTFAVASIALGVILTVTSVFRFCPLYRLFGISTCRIP